jgi:hypothetical protein
MKKKAVKKMTLTKETLRDLAGTALHEVVGGSETMCRTICGSRCASDCETCGSVITTC